MTSDNLLTQFDNNTSLYESFTDRLQRLVSEILETRGIRVHSVASRTKSRESFRQKVTLSEGRYREIDEVTDVSAVRVVTYFANDVHSVADAIRADFLIDASNSVDKRDLLDPDRFGYLSLHYVVSLPMGRTELTEFRRFAGLKAEVQVRSILQHAWAEIEHDLGYKTSLGVPRDVRRQFSRLAGLLELADAEFVAIRDALERYEAAVPQLIETQPGHVHLDKASLKNLISEGPIVPELDSALAQFTEGKLFIGVGDESIETYVAGFKVLGITTIAELTRALEMHRHKIIAFASRWLSKKSSGLSQAAALHYLAIVRLAELNDQAVAEKYFSTTQIVRPDQAKAFFDLITQTLAEIDRTGTA